MMSFFFISLYEFLLFLAGLSHLQLRHDVSISDSLSLLYLFASYFFPQMFNQPTIPLPRAIIHRAFSSIYFRLGPYRPRIRRVKVHGELTPNIEPLTLNPRP